MYSSESYSSPDDIKTCKTIIESTCDGSSPMETKILSSSQVDLKGTLSGATFSQKGGSRKLSSRRTIVPNFDLDSSQSDNDAQSDSASLDTQILPTNRDYFRRETNLEENTKTEQICARPAMYSNITQDTWSHVNHGESFLNIWFMKK